MASSGKANPSSEVLIVNSIALCGAGVVIGTCIDANSDLQRVSRRLNPVH